MSEPGKNLPTTFRSGSTWIWKRREPHGCRRVGKRALAPCPPSRSRWEKYGGHGAPLPTLRTSVLAPLHPVLEHLQRHGAVVLGGLGDRTVVAFLDPGLVRRGAVARERQPHQAAGRLPRQLVAVKKHLSEHGLGLVLALLRGEAKPARAVSRIAGRADAVEIKPRQIVLGV